MKKSEIIVDAEYIIRNRNGENKIPQRLIQMGVLSGSRFRIVRIAPMGGTVEVVIDETGNIALRMEELLHLDCELVAIPLSKINDIKNRPFRIKEFKGGFLFKQKMDNRGLAIGSTIFEAEKNQGFHLKLDEDKIVTVGRGEASKIILKPVNK